MILWVLLVGTESEAQFRNSGGQVTIERGGAIICEDDFENLQGTITNNGRIEVGRSFLNQAKYKTGADLRNSIFFKGGGTATLRMNGDSVSLLRIDKTNGSDTVQLDGNVTVLLEMDNYEGTFSTQYHLNPSNTLIADRNVSLYYNPGKEIVGGVTRLNPGNQDLYLTNFNSENLTFITVGGTAPSSVSTVMLPGTSPSLNEKEVQRKFLFSSVGGSGYNVYIQFPYKDNELGPNNTEANLVPWHLTSNEWSAFTTVVRSPDNWLRVYNVPAAAFSGEWKLADPRYTFNVTAFLKGAWNNPTGLMRTSLNSGGLLPLSQPFNTAPYSYAGSESVASIPGVNIVDWVLLELRKPSSGLPADANSSTLIGRKAAFLLANGNIVDLDGTTPAAFNITKQGSGSFIVMRHRNHLAVMSNAVASNAAGTFTNDFSIHGNNYQKPGVSSPPCSLLATSGAGLNRYGLWPGDVNSNGSVGSSDVTPINVAIAGSASGNTNVYNVRDVNMDKNITTADISVTNASAGSLAATSSSRQAAPKKESHVPGEVKN